jgi:hypothetical protein
VDVAVHSLTKYVAPWRGHRGAIVDLGIFLEGNTPV